MASLLNVFAELLCNSHGLLENNKRLQNFVDREICPLEYRFVVPLIDINLHYLLFRARNISFLVKFLAITCFIIKCYLIVTNLLIGKATQVSIEFNGLRLM